MKQVHRTVVNVVEIERVNSFLGPDQNDLIIRLGVNLPRNAKEIEVIFMGDRQRCLTIFDQNKKNFVHNQTEIPNNENIELFQFRGTSSSWVLIVFYVIDKIIILKTAFFRHSKQPDGRTDTTSLKNA